MSNVEGTLAAAPSNNHMRLFLASFMTLIAAGIGFAIRGAVLGQWGSKFGFTSTELGLITGAGLWGFPVSIIALSFIADRVGYGPLMVLAFVLHFVSAVVMLAATPVFQVYGKTGAYVCLYGGSFIFALANGTCEAVINPLTATLFPNEKTHWLNILHAGWPGGMVIGGLLGLVMNYASIRWEYQMAMFLVPVLIYGALMVGQRFPHSEARVAGVGLGTMLLEFLSPILLFLVLIHAMVGFVELGTDSWITKITGTILNAKSYGIMLFIWTSSLMFVLRFFAGPIVHKISPLGLLFCSAVLGCCGLLLLGNAPSNGTALAIGFCVLAATIYGFGKTFFWPTMLGVVSERFPKGGALTLGVVGGVGTLSAGLLGGPIIGYEQDYYATNTLEAHSPATYDRYRADDKSTPLPGVLPAVAGLNGSKVTTALGEPGENNGDGKILEQDIKNVETSGHSLAEYPNLEQLNAWWQTNKKYAPVDIPPLGEATLYGGKMALALTAAVPAIMALCYLLLILYFKARGGYKAEVLLEHKAKDQEFTGGVEGPADM